MYHTYKKEKPQ